jgi:predicted metalloendopeptidase
VAASFAVTASLAQWWSEMDSDAQEEAIDEIKEKFDKFQNPLLFSHPRAKSALELNDVKKWRF